jgi:hypothetical protein
VDTPSENDPAPQSSTKDIPEQLADLLENMILPRRSGEELGHAFRFAVEYPPITKLSLAELDIQSIITNIKLRHDINFDRDLSFRPNLDGAKGLEKQLSAARYWKALVAELELYVRIFQGTPPLLDSEHDRAKFVACAKRRIPNMFETIRDILKSLVPDRDHVQVEEHFDIPMLMQEIERGVCDLVRLAEWLAHLLKEHCAPMRDELVDKMVESTKAGVAGNDSECIIKGLRELLGILEAMKLVSQPTFNVLFCPSNHVKDVANHQIRNLKTLLIEDTVGFERRFHLDRLLHHKPRINLDHAQRWYETGLRRFRPVCTAQRDTARLYLEVFVRAVTSSLFGPEDYGDLHLPGTFYLDQDRLRTLRSDVNDLIYLDICLDLFSQLLHELGYSNPVPPATRGLLRTSLNAIMGDAAVHGHSYGPTQWLINSENIAMELVRQAVLLADAPPIYTLETCQRTNQRLRTLLLSHSTGHAAALEEQIIPQILATVNRHVNSSPIELFNNLLANSNPGLSPRAPVGAPFGAVCNTFLQPSTTSNAPDHAIIDIANRITHIALLHWRVWGPVAYVLDDEDCSSSIPCSSSACCLPPPSSTSSNVGPPPAPSPPASRHRLPPFPPPPPPHPPAV